MRLLIRSRSSPQPQWRWGVGRRELHQHNSRIFPPHSWFLQLLPSTASLSFSLSCGSQGTWTRSQARTEPSAMLCPWGLPVLPQPLPSEWPSSLCFPRLFQGCAAWQTPHSRALCLSKTRTRTGRHWVVTASQGTDWQLLHTASSLRGISTFPKMACSPDLGYM